MVSDDQLGRRLDIYSGHTRFRPYDRCLNGRLGRPSPRFTNPGKVVSTVQKPAYQQPGIASNFSFPPGFSAKNCGIFSTGAHRQHHQYILCKQTRRDEICHPVPTGSRAVGMGHSPQHHFESRACRRNREHSGGYAQQVTVGLPQVGTRTTSGGQGFPGLGQTSFGSVCDSAQQEMPVLRQQVSSTGIKGKCPVHEMVWKLCVRFSASTSDTESVTQNEAGELHSQSDCTSVAAQKLVPGAFAPSPDSAHPPSANDDNAVKGQRSGGPPGSSISTFTRMAPDFLEFEHLDIPQDFRDILTKSRAPSTIKTYRLKWRIFCCWCEDNNIHPLEAPPEQVLPYLLSLAKSGLTFSSIKAHLAALSRFRRNSISPSLCASSLIKSFMKGLFREFAPVKLPPPEWELNIILMQLMKHPFEPIHKAELKFLTWKVALLLALTSVRRVSEIQAFTIKEPFLYFTQDYVTLRTNPNFIPKVPSQFHLNEPVVLKTFFPNPETPAEKTLHSLDVKRCLKFYLQRTKDIRKSDQLFVAYGQATLGTAVTKATIARWLASAIHFCHEKANKPLLRKVRAHSTRTMAASTALFAGVTISNICRAATWKSAHTFTKHYCLQSTHQEDAAVGQAVLRHLFP